MKIQYGVGILKLQMEACDVMQIKEKHAATIQVVYKLCELVPLF